MSTNVQLSIYEIVGSAICVSSDNGQKVYDRVAAALGADRPVEISFLNVDSLTSAFLNTALGQLYGNFSEEFVKKQLTVKDMAQDDLVLLKRVVETAKAYFKDPVAYTALERAVMGDDDAE